MEHHIALKAEILGYIGSLPVTNTLLVSWLVMLILIIVSLFATRKMNTVPSGLQNFMEMIIEAGFKTVEDLAHTKTRVFFPIVMTFFLFIITANWLGLMPGVGTVGFYRDEKPVILVNEVHPESNEAQDAGHASMTNTDQSEVPVSDHSDSPVSSDEETVTEEHATAVTHEEEHHPVFVPLLRSINSDLNMTLGLALISAFLTHMFAVKYLGVKDYLKKWFALNPIFLFVGLLELVSEVTKVVSLSFRLFGNIFAGEVVLTTVATLAPFTAFLVPLPFYFLEIIVGFVQAAVFMMLSLVFMVLLTEKHEAH